MVGLALHGFLCGRKSGTKVCKRVTVQSNQRIVIHGCPPVSMLQGQDSSLIDKCNHIGPIFLEGVDHLNDWWDRVLAQDSVFVLLGIHSTMLDDTHADVDDVMVIHPVRSVQRWRRKCQRRGALQGLETFGGMPGGSHSLPIFFAILGHGMPVLHDEPVKHVEKDSVWLFHADWCIYFTNCFW